MKRTLITQKQALWQHLNLNFIQDLILTITRNQIRFKMISDKKNKQKTLSFHQLIFHLKSLSP